MAQTEKSQKKLLIEEIKRKLPLEDLLSRYQVKRGSAKNSYYCPFHQEKHPSFVASNEKGWKCLSNNLCGSGDQITFIQKYENLSLEEAIIKASAFANITQEEKKGKIIINELEEKHFKYLLQRGIKPDTAKAFNLKSKNDFILFPQKRDNKITGYKAINIKTKQMFFDGTDNQSKLFPNYDFGNAKHVVFTAGEYDCMYLTQKLLENDLNEYKVVTSSTGEGNFPKDLDRLEAFYDIESFKIFYDHDETGKKGAFKLAEELKKLGKVVEIYNFPENSNEKYDISDFFNEGHSLQDLFLLKKIIYKPINQENFDTSLTIFDDYRFVTPLGYEITDQGITKTSVGLRNDKTEIIAPLPAIIIEEAVNTDENIVSFTLAFKKNGRWFKQQVERSILCDAKKIIGISSSGFPVHSGNAKNMVVYLNDFEMANMSFLKRIYLTQNNGWKLADKEKVFGLGNNILGLVPKDYNISFSPELGFERFTKALNEKGSFESWLKTLSPLMKTNPKVAFAVYASLSAPLLQLLDGASFLIHFWGDSSMGKTTAMEIAASVWGNPAKETGGLITSWNNTMVFVERLAGFFNDLPMFLDDSQTADDRAVSKIMYMIGNSTGRGRGKKAGGIDNNTSWHTVCFSTGEKQLTESTQYDGAKARTIEIAGSPFGRNEGKTVNEVKTCVRENYGHLGKLFINYLLEALQDPEKLEEIKDAFKTFREILSYKASNEIGNRMAHYFAVIQLAGALAERLFDLGGDPYKAIESCFEEVLHERKSEGDTSTRALNEVISYAQSNIKSFLGKSDEFIKEHFGVWKESEYIAFYPHKLKDILARAGFSYNSIIRSWGDREWIKKDPERVTFQISFGGQRFRTIAVRWEIINNLI